MIFRYICRFCFCFVSQSEFEKLIVAPFLCIIILKKRYDKKKKVYYPRYGGKRNYYNHENPLKKYKP